MIVFDASTVVSAAIARGSIPDQAVRHGFATDEVAVSPSTLAELIGVLARPRMARFLTTERSSEVLALVQFFGVTFEPSERVSDCRDPNDDMYLELAAASGATTIVSSDGDLLVLHPWRGVRILRPAVYLAEAAGT